MAGRFAAGGPLTQLMLAVAAALDDDRSRLRRAEIDERHGRARVGELRHERRDVLGHAGARCAGSK